MVSVTRVIDVLQPSGLKQFFDLLNPIIDRIHGFESEYGLCLFAADSIVTRVLKIHLGPFYLEIRKVVPDLIGEIDDPHILSVQVVDACMRAIQAIDNCPRGVKHVQQGTKLVTAEDCNVSGSLRAHGQAVNNQIQANAGKQIADAEKRAQPEDDGILLREASFGHQFCNQRKL